ncbi:MAG TPA: DUF983 domain-containing protein [Acidimicrobiia bacterium]|nr:DUF983 domain-containing protein [Acidimicrobiia bacterium]
MRDPSASRGTLLARGFRGRCPRCGERAIFASFLELHERCPTCGVKFERESGYWVGAMIVVTTITFATFILVFVGGILLTWPDVPWNWLLIVTLAANLVIPFLAYPRSKTLWMAMEMSWHPLEENEVEAARAYLQQNLS